MLSRFVINAPVAILCLFLTYCWVEASQEISQHSLKTVETENGDIYDCVDFYKQPAFEKPLLKNHTFYPQMRPSSRPKWTRRSKKIEKKWARRSKLARNIFRRSFIDIKYQNGSCPKGTVPIRRMSNNDLFQAKLLRERYSQLGVYGADQSQSEVFFAVAQSKSDPTKAYYGVGAVITVYRPNVQPSQYSSGEIIIKGGTDAIIVGWTVNPMVYKDNQTRFFIYTVAGDLHCFDGSCGFITVREDIPLDFVLHPVSTMGGPIYIDQFFVYQDEKNGNWWLEVGVGKYATIIGFWPQQIFRGLYNSGSYIACGGEAYGPSNIKHPEMGTGYFPKSEFKQNNAYCQNINIVNEQHQVVFADDLETYASDDRHYGAFKVKDRAFVFGGPNSY